jgi:hypothetical protein
VRYAIGRFNNLTKLTMTDSTDQEHLNNPANTQTDNHPDETITNTQAVSQKQTTENMEIHHPHHVTHKKKWGEYLLEFFMLFLAVFLGFVAENIRENAIEARREKVYIRSFYEDLTADEKDLQRIINNLDQEVKIADELGKLLANVTTKTPANRIYMDLTQINRSSATNLYVNDRTVVQLRAGGMSIIQNKQVSDSIVGYYKEVETIQFLDNESLNIKRALREKFSTILNAAYFDKVTDSTNQIIDPPETLFLRSTDPDAINSCLLWVNNIKHLSGGLKVRIGELKNRATRIKAFIDKQYHLKDE